MTFDDIKARWQSYSTRKKWLIVGVGVLIIAAAGGGGTHGDDRTAGYPMAATVGAPGTIGGGQGYGQPGYAGQPVYGGQPAYGGGPAAAGGGQADVMAGWQHNQDVQERAAKAFDQNLRDESTIRSNENGQVYSGVSNPVADSAVDSGAAAQVPTAELPVSSDPGQ